MPAPRRPRDGGRSTGFALILAGCAFFAVSVLLPVMRWQPSAAHPTAGSARVFGGDAFTLVDAGFPGSALVIPSAASVAVLAVVALLACLGRSTWRPQVVAAAVACYYPAWVLYVFLRKLEDDVYPAEGAAVLLIAFCAIAVGLLVGRPRAADQGPALTIASATQRPEANA